MLLILQEHLPAPYNKRVPRLIDMEKDDRGFVAPAADELAAQRRASRSRTWNSPARAPICSASLHDIPRVIHLDLRLDNFVITPNGVGFVDFGSAVRENEDLSRNPLLQSLFGELMRTSQIQRMMEKMTLSGQVTSQVDPRAAADKPDKAADFFYLALQFNSPHANPDLAGLIDYDPDQQRCPRPVGADQPDPPPRKTPRSPRSAPPRTSCTASSGFSWDWIIPEQIAGSCVQHVRTSRRIVACAKPRVSRNSLPDLRERMTTLICGSSHRAALLALLLGSLIRNLRAQHRRRHPAPGRW